MPTLRLKLPDQGEITHELTAACITIGRRPDNTIQIIDRSVSAHHAELIAEDGHYRLHDLGSTNLTFVEGAAIGDFHLHQPCKIAFGTVTCEYDPDGGTSDARMSAAQLERDAAFLRGENSELQGKIVTLQRQVDILSSARLVTKRTETTPFATHNDTLKAIMAERDDLRHLSTGLKLELERLREELAMTVRERDAARQSCDLLQVEKVTRGRELQELRRQSETIPVMAPPPIVTTAGLTVIEQTAPPRRPVSFKARPPVAHSASGLTPEKASTQRISLPLPAEFEPVETALRLMQGAVQGLAADPSDTNSLAQLTSYASDLVHKASCLGDHPISRLGHSIEALLQDFASRIEPPLPAHISTLNQAIELISRLLDPRYLTSKALPQPRILAVDDDADLLQTLTASMEMTRLSTTTCGDSSSAHTLLEKNDFDLLLLDVRLPGLDGTVLCGQIRENDRYRKTPVIFLTVENTLEQRAQASLSGGNDFLPKPFNTAELAVKAETWIWKSRFGML